MSLHYRSDLSVIMFENRVSLVLVDVWICTFFPSSLTSAGRHAFFFVNNSPVAFEVI